MYLFSESQTSRKAINLSNSKSQQTPQSPEIVLKKSNENAEEAEENDTITHQEEERNEGKEKNFLKKKM